MIIKVPLRIEKSKFRKTFNIVTAYSYQLTDFNSP